MLKERVEERNKRLWANSWQNAMIGEDLDVVLVLVKVAELIDKLMAGEVVEQCAKEPM